MGARISCDNSVATTFQVPAKNLPVTKATKPREAQELVSPSGIYSSQYKYNFPVRVFSPFYYDLIIYWHIRYHGSSTWMLNESQITMQKGKEC